MKNTLKLTFLAVILSLSLAACNGNKSPGSADSAKVDSSTSIKTSTDTSIKIDTGKSATDTSAAKLDTVSKTTTKHTVIKKTITRKD